MSAAADVIRRLQELHDAEKPNIVLGDDDSIYLTPYQLGVRDGYTHAIRLLREMEDPT